MPFSADVKNELCRVGHLKDCCAAAEAYGVLLFCNTFSYREIRIVTENRAFAQRLQTVFRRAFGFSFDVAPEDMEGRGKHIFRITDPEKIKKVFETYGYSPENYVSLHINMAILEEACCRVSFLRGAFLAGGSVTDPAKSYHLELVTPHYHVKGETYSVLYEMGLTPKDSTRNGSYILYFKQSESIEDLLTMMGAPIAAMELMNTKVEKDLRNSVNRRVNCETANVGRTVDAAQTQLAAIRRIEASGVLESLPEKLKETARLRLENPEATLTELAAMFDPPVTKSCLNHRLRKLVELA